ncbi:DNA helicase [bacterium]|nr:DNA helicase [bacterium]
MSEVDDSLLRQDESSRERALEPASFIVEAPAGAGKTELLTQRFLRLLATVEEPEEVVAITFTLKAAGEMKNRILDSLQRAAVGEMPEAPHKRVTHALATTVLEASTARGWCLMEQPGRLRVQTIDAFCMALSRQMPVLSRLGAQPRLARDARPHYAEAARRTLVLLEEAEESLAQPVADALRHVDNDMTRLRDLLAEMLGRRDQWLGRALAAPSRDDMEVVLAALTERDLRHAAVTLAPWLARVRPLVLAAAARVGAASPMAALAAWEAPLAGEADELPLWLGLCELVLTGTGSRRATVTKNQGFPPEAKTEKAAFLDALADLSPAAVDALARLRELPPATMSDQEWATVAALSRLLVLAAAQLVAVFQEAGEMDFIEVAQRALLALGPEDAPTDLSLLLDYRISHLLVDEFQDTSPTQVDLLRRLTAGWQAGDGKTLFLVGDPMQSIYRFRQADVGLFIQAARQGLPNVPLTNLRLNRNNRSRPDLVHWVNGIFPAVFPPADSVERSAIAYRASLATREAGEGPGVFVHPLVMAGAGDEGERLQARMVLDLIRQERRRDPQQSIAVLVRKRRQLDALVAEIRRHEPGLPFTAVDIESLQERQIVQDLLALTRALHHRADRVNWLALLRAPWCGLTLADLHALAGDNHIATVWRLMNEDVRMTRLSADGQARLGFVRTVLAEAFAHRGRQSPRRWVEGVWRCLGGVGLLRDAAEATDALAFLDLIDRLDAEGGFTPDALETAMADLYAAPVPDADPRLQFMTIHKSKGLEFDCVILPGLNDGMKPNSHALMAWESVAIDDLEESLIAAPLTKAAAGPSVYRSLRRLEKEREDNESARQLYVAATRARERLHLVAQLTSNAKGERKAATGSFLALLWPALSAQFEATELIEADATPAGEGVFTPWLIRTVAPATPPELAAREDAGAAAPSPDAGEDAASTLDADIGTLVHAYLERIAIDGPEAWPPQRCADLMPAMEVWLARRGHEGAALAEGLARVGDSLRRTLESAEGRWVLAPRAEAAAELALARVEARGFSTHIVDRTFVENGVRWIVDYKTARPAGDETSLRSHAEGYREQLERYASLFRDEGLPIRAGIFYTALGCWVPLGELS